MAWPTIVTTLQRHFFPSLLFTWLNEPINERSCRDDFITFIDLFDLPGPQNLTPRPNSLDQFAINFANECLHNFVQKVFESHVAKSNSEGISRFVSQVPYLNNSECVRLLQNQPGKLIYIMDDQACCMAKKTAIQWLKHLESVGKSLIIQVRLSSPLRLPNIYHQSLQRTHQLLI